MNITRNFMRRAVAVFSTWGICVALGAAAPSGKELQPYRAAEKVAKQHIAIFDELDFEVFTHQQWERLHESHSKDASVHWPDGHSATGIDKHIEDLKAMFVYAPDTRSRLSTPNGPV